MIDNDVSVVEEGESFDEIMKQCVEIEKLGILRQSEAFERASQALNALDSKDVSIFNKLEDRSKPSFASQLQVIEKAKEESNRLRVERELIKKENLANKQIQQQIDQDNDDYKATLSPSSSSKIALSLSNALNSIPDHFLDELEVSLGLTPHNSDPSSDPIHVEINDPDIADVLNYLDSSSAVPGRSQPKRTYVYTSTSPRLPVDSPAPASTGNGHNYDDDIKG